MSKNKSLIPLNLRNPHIFQIKMVKGLLKKLIQPIVHGAVYNALSFRCRKENDKFIEYCNRKDFK